MDKNNLRVSCDGATSGCNSYEGGRLDQLALTTAEPTAAASPSAAAASAAAAALARQLGDQVKPRHALEPHHPDGLLENPREAGAPENLERVPVTFLHQPALVPAHLARGRVVKAQPRDVRLFLGPVIDPSERVVDVVQDVRVHRGGRGGDGEVLELPGEKLLVRGEEK